MSRHFRLHEAQSDAARTDRIKRELTDCGLDNPASIATIQQFLMPDGIKPLNTAAESAEDRRQRIFDTVLKFLHTVARTQPVLLTAEDLQWADASTLELLNRLSGTINENALCLIATSRPTADINTELTGAHNIRLERLSRNDARNLVARVTSARLFDKAVVDLILDRSDGVPLYLEELTKTIVESKITADSNRQTPAIPATLQGSLMARLDQMASAKQVAQFAAALGREFSYRLLQAIVDIEPSQLKRDLARLIDAELLTVSGTLPDANYQFKHALIVDAAYQSLLRSTRRRVHAAIAAAIARELPDKAAQHPEWIAYHHTAAGNPDEASHHWLRAAEVAVQRCSYIEASKQLSSTFEALDQLNEGSDTQLRELQAQLLMGAVHSNLSGQGCDERLNAYHRAHALNQHLGKPLDPLAVLLPLQRCHTVRGEVEAACETREEIAKLLGTTTDVRLKTSACRSLGTDCFYDGHFERCLLYTSPSPRDLSTSRMPSSA